jgi:hypothetical protein
MSRNDPIRERYFKAVELAEIANEALFYLGALLSFATLLVDKATHPKLYEWTLAAFVVVTVALFAIGLCSRLYWIPRAEGKRRQDFFTSACSVGLTHQPSDGYYNNDYTDSIDRMAAQVFENSLFSKSIALRMAWTERTKVSVYALAWIVCLMNRETDLGWAVAATQAIFSEQVLSKAFRLEWLRVEFEKTYEAMYRLFQARPKGAEFTAMMLDTLASYETAKANGGVVLSSKIFQRLNPALSLEWDQVKATLRM